MAVGQVIGYNARARLRQARILLGPGNSVGCTIRNLTSTGARVEFSKQVKLPKEFRFFLIASDAPIIAELDWQLGLSAAIRFARQPAVPQAGRPGSGRQPARRY